MKMTSAHYDYLKQAMQSQAHRIPDHRERIKDDPRIKDLEKRIRWDWMGGSVSSGWICDNLYHYLNDTHIDTALRSIVKEIEVPQ